MSTARRKAADVKKLLIASELLWKMAAGEYRPDHPFTNTFLGTRAADLEDIARRLDPSAHSAHVMEQAKSKG